MPVGVPFPPFAFELIRQAVPSASARDVLLFGHRYGVEHAAALGIVGHLAMSHKSLLDVAVAQVQLAFANALVRVVI